MREHEHGFICSLITFASTKVFPDPVIPCNTWLCPSPLPIVLIASGCPSAGLYGALSLNFICVKMGMDIKKCNGWNG